MSALERIEQARTKPVAFAVRANISFFGVPCDDCPAAGNQVYFEGNRMITQFLLLIYTYSSGMAYILV